tara:strand:+ start:402 stop:1142 length:741 start_codon:yes stop_codon:yes gene_type:complete
MINESKKQSPQQWKKWEESGAMKKQLEAKEARQEQEARKKIENIFDFDVSELSEQTKQQMQEDTKRFREGMLDEDDEGNIIDRYDRHIEKIRDHIDLAPEEREHGYAEDGRIYGTTNNFWNVFRGIPLDEKIKITDENAMSCRKLMIWSENNILMDAFEAVSFKKIESMLEALHRNEELEESWKEKLNTKNSYGIEGEIKLAFPKDQKIAEELEEHRLNEITRVNALRHLALELKDRGVYSFEIHG